MAGGRVEDLQLRRISTRIDRSGQNSKSKVGAVFGVIGVCKLNRGAAGRNGND